MAKFTQAANSQSWNLLITEFFVQPSGQAVLHHHAQQARLRRTPFPSKKKEAGQPEKENQLRN